MLNCIALSRTVLYCDLFRSVGTPRLDWTVEIRQFVMLRLSYSFHLQFCFVKRENKMASLCAILGCLVMLIVPCISAQSKRSAPIAYYVFDVFSSASQSDVKASLDGLQLLHSFKVNGTFRIVSHIHHSAAFRHDLCHTIFFQFAKNTDSAPQPFARGGTTEVQILQQYIVVFRL